MAPFVAVVAIILSLSVHLTEGHKHLKYRETRALLTEFTDVQSLTHAVVQQGKKYKDSVLTKLIASYLS